MVRLPNPFRIPFSVIFSVDLLRFLQKFQLHLHNSRRSEYPGAPTIPAICSKDSRAPQLEPAEPKPSISWHLRLPRGDIFTLGLIPVLGFLVLPVGRVFHSNQETSFSLSVVYPILELGDLDFSIAPEDPAIESSDAEGILWQYEMI
jgi:hypothetical protein